MASSMVKSTEEEHPIKVFGWAAHDSAGQLSPFNFSRRNTGPKDVKIKILYCGVCHSDIHFVRNEWGSSVYPMVPGHEMVGVVTEVGSEVVKFKIGDKAAVGCMVGGCDKCEDCTSGRESYCRNTILTYNFIYHDNTRTYGGYSEMIVVEEHYAIKFPDSLPMDSGAPLLCAGITVYSPLKYYGLDKPGLHVGVVGLGGLGHLAVKFAKAFGAQVTVISTSLRKKEEAIEKLGADAFLVSRDPEHMKAAIGTMDGIIDTVSAVHSLQPLIDLLKNHGKLVMVGAPDKPLELQVFPLLVGRKMVAGSATGGMQETQEMIDFAAAYNITADIELIPMNYINTAMERLVKADVKYRFVIDIANTLGA